MAVTWGIDTLDYDIESNRATVAHFTVRDESGSIVGGMYSTVDITKQAKSHAYDRLSESQVIAWVKEAVGAAAISAYEAKAGAARQLKTTPIKGRGKPWS